MKDLVKRAQRGDDDAFDELYRVNVGRVYAICLRLCGDPQRAGELTQDVFVRAWENLGSFHGDSRFSSWLYRLAVNVVLDSLRATGRKERRRVDLDVSILPSADAFGALDRRFDLERAIAGLPERARIALVLYGVEGYKYEDIAEAMGIAVGTVKAHIHRARILLLERLDR